jgi:hypothetical protein
MKRGEIRPRDEDAFQHDRKEMMKPFGLAASFVAAAYMMIALPPMNSPADADEAISFEGKAITIVIGSATGGTTDTSARLMGTFFSKHLPGKPSVIVQNRPGSHSLAAMGYFTRARPDGLTAAVGSVSQIDPATYRLPQSHYDPTNFAMVGGIDLGGGIMILRTEARLRLTDKTASPVVMGSVSGYPHTTMMMAAWGIDYLGWNVRWVSGYPSPTAAMILALERSEIDMTGFSATGLTGSLLDPSRYTVIYQTGSSGCIMPSSLRVIAATPLFATAMKGKIADPLAQKAFDYWCNSASTLVWMALPPGTPAGIVDVYRAAFGRIAADPAFVEQGRMFSEEFSPVSSQSLSATVHAYGEVSPEVTGFMPRMLRRQGLRVN